MFREGSPASEGVRMFAKTGRSDKLDDGGGDEIILDTFTAPNAPTGAARSQAQFFVDGNHSKVRNRLTRTILVRVELIRERFLRIFCAKTSGKL